MRQKIFAFRFMWLLIFAVLATFKIWISTQSMRLQSKLDLAQKTHERLRVESNRLLLKRSQLINRDALRQQALGMGYEEANETLYVIHP